MLQQKVPHVHYPLYEESTFFVLKPFSHQLHLMSTSSWIRTHSEYSTEWIFNPPHATDSSAVSFQTGVPALFVIASYKRFLCLWSSLLSFSKPFQLYYIIFKYRDQSFTQYSRCRQTTYLHVMSCFVLYSFLIIPNTWFGFLTSSE